MKFKTIMLLTLASCTFQWGWSQAGEKLDSITTYEHYADRLSSKSIFQYDDLARDTTVKYYEEELGTTELRLNRTVKTSFSTNQMVTETFRATPGRLVSRVTTTLDEDGAVLESVTELINATSGNLEPSTRWVTTTLDETRWERDTYHWNGSAFVLAGRRITEYQAAGGSIRTRYQLVAGDFVPEQRTTQLFEESTGVETRYLIENYFAASERWAPYLLIATTLDAPNFLAARLIEVASFDTGLLERFDSTAIYFNDDWTAAQEASYRPRGEQATYVLSQEMFYTYTAAGNLASSDLYLPASADGELVLTQTDTYYYSNLDVTLTEAPTDEAFPVNLIFQNPAVRPQVYLSGQEVGASYTLLVSELTGRTLSQQTVAVGETVDIGRRRLPSGWYLLTLTDGERTRTWQWVVP